MSAVTEIPAAGPEAAYAHFAARLDVETDSADVAADLKAGTMPYTVLDVRSRRAWHHGRIPGALSVPATGITAEVAAALPDGLLVVYCWGPGCNGAHKAALELTRHGRRVKEMLGGFEYWVREGQPVEGKHAGRLSELAQHELVG
jgi:rhodanese-related sulfurtransferase